MSLHYGGHSDISEDAGQEAYESLIEDGISGLNCLRSGYRNQQGAFFDLDGAYGYYWTSIEYNETAGTAYAFLRVGGRLLEVNMQKSRGHSCRCVED